MFHQTELVGKFVVMFDDFGDLWAIRNRMQILNCHARKFSDVWAAGDLHAAALGRACPQLYQFKIPNRTVHRVPAFHRLKFVQDISIMKKSIEYRVTSRFPATA